MRVLFLILLSTTSAVTFAQDYPTKPVRMVEPFGAGGGVDTIARVVSAKLSELWGQPVTVENHPGKGGDTAKARAAYQDFLTLWKDADPDIPVLKEVKAEYANLNWYLPAWIP